MSLPSLRDLSAQMSQSEQPGAEPEPHPDGPGLSTKAAALSPEGS
jgi:hypothetical protein